MTLIFIHGIAMDPDPAHAGAIEAAWRAALARHDRDGRIDAQPRRLAYYADILDKYRPGLAMARGEALRAHRTDGEDLQAELLPEIMASVDFDALGLPEIGRALQASNASSSAAAFLAPISDYLPRLPTELLVLIRRFLRQADLYFTNREAAAEIDARVLEKLEPALTAGERPIIIAHSLGSVIAYKLLAEMRGRRPADQVPQLITMGSPLALSAIRRRLPAPFGRPAIAAEWRNYYATTDFVTGGQGIPAGDDARIFNHQRRGMPFPYHLPEDYLENALLADHLAAKLP